ncbi:MAG: hypothetical protein JJ959_18655 [Nisaea sp.]|uniref:hypothetical protein n=1 Tax=Nisaea sp. TaxID=2024842 RepID=UPI001B15D62E|nr:hypothetical protein [Nisaea sp.]MBO6562574.1 hypothetical protein [Nisaea sp.]
MERTGRHGEFGFHWSEWAASLCLGAVVAAISLNFHAGGPETHPAPVVGELTFSGAGKGGDFLLVWAFAAGTLGALAAMAVLRSRIADDPEARASFREYLTWSLLPAVLWCASQVLGKPFSGPPYFADLSLLYLSAVLILLLIGATVAVRLGRLADNRYRDLVAAAVGAPVLAALSAICMATAAARLFLVPEMMSGRVVGILAGAAFLLFYLVALLVLSGRLPERGLGRIFAAAQLGLPLAFFALILPPSAAGLPWERTVPLTAAFLAVPALAALFGYAALVQSWRRAAVNLPVMSVAAIAVLVLFADGRPTSYGMDNPLDYYHHGEWLIPWQQWADFGKLPYIDYSPSHGLVDYLSGMVNGLLLDGTLAGFEQARQLVRGASTLAAALALGRLSGPVPALLALLLFPVTGRYPIFISVFCGLVFLTARSLQSHPVRWLWCYLAAGTALVLLAPGPGAMAVIASAPLALIHLWSSARQTPGKLALAAFGVAALAVGMFLFGPGEIVLAQIRFMLENRPLYGAVHGLDWAHSLARDWPVNGAFWELARNLWLPAMLLLLVVAAMRLWRGRADLAALVREDRLAVFAGAAALFMLLVIPHTIGRIDAGGPSRTGALSMFALALVGIPLAWSMAAHLRSGIVVALVAVLGMLGPAFAHRLSVTELLRLPQATRAVLPGELTVDGAALGLPALGRTIVPEALVTRMAPLKRALDGWLEADETYLDLSNANAQYFYTGRAVPIESGAILTLPAEGMQSRSVARLSETPPPVILLGTLPSGAGPFTLPLRAPLLASWVFDQLREGVYDIVFVEPFVFAVRPDRLTVPVLSAEGQKDILTRLFAPPPLANLPSVWGASADTTWFALQSDVAEFEGGAGTQASDPGHYLVSGTRAGFDIVPGADADFLLFELACESGKGAGKGRVSVNGGSSLDFDLSSGLHVVPLDADPMVLYAGRVETLRLDLDLDPHCAGASVSRFQKAARRRVPVSQ